MRELNITSERQLYACARDMATGERRYIPVVTAVSGGRKYCCKVWHTASEAQGYATKVQRRYIEKYTLFRKTLWIQMQYSKLSWYKKLEWRIKKVWYERKGRNTILSLLDIRLR